MTRRINLTPGYNEDEEIFGTNTKTVSNYVNKIIPFMGKDPIFKTGQIADIGPENPKIRLIGEKLGFVATPIVVDDFNFDKLPHGKKFDVIFCLEVLEHLQNPLFFMKELKDLLNDDGTIYLSMPSNPKFMWAEFHFYEMKRKHFEKWIVIPLGLKIVKHKRFNYVTDWRSVFIGIRPLIKILTGKISIVVVIRGFFQIHNLYEIKKDN